MQPPELLRGNTPPNSRNRPIRCFSRSLIPRGRPIRSSCRPGYLHDVGAAFFPFAEHSPAFRSLDLAGAGLRWACARRESSHPALDGTCPTIARDPELTAATFGEDGPAWLRLAHWQQAMGA